MHTEKWCWLKMCLVNMYSLWGQGLLRETYNSDPMVGIYTQQSSTVAGWSLYKHSHRHTQLRKPYKHSHRHTQFRKPHKHSERYTQLSKLYKHLHRHTQSRKSYKHTKPSPLHSLCPHPFNVCPLVAWRRGTSVWCHWQLSFIRSFSTCPSHGQ